MDPSRQRVGCVQALISSGKTGVTMFFRVRAQNPVGFCFDCQLGGLDLQALLAKLLHYGFTQNIGIEFAGFCKFDNSLGDHLIGTIAAVPKPSGARAGVK